MCGESESERTEHVTWTVKHDGVHERVSDDFGESESDCDGGLESGGGYCDVDCESGHGYCGLVVNGNGPAPAQDVSGDDGPDVGKGLR